MDGNDGDNPNPLSWLPAGFHGRGGVGALGAHVLSHLATWAFVLHSGWASALESVWSGLRRADGGVAVVRRATDERHGPAREHRGGSGTAAASEGGRWHGGARRDCRCIEGAHGGCGKSTSG